MTDRESATTEDGTARRRAAMVDARRQSAMRVFAGITDGLPAEMCERAGVDEDGNLTGERLTDYGIKIADIAINVLHEATTKMLKAPDEVEREAPRPAKPAPTGGDQDWLGVRGPLRAAMRAAAASFAAALDEGETDDAPAKQAAASFRPGRYQTQTVTLGEEPFLLLRASRISGGAVAMNITSGGGLVTEAKAAEDDVTVESLLSVAMEAVDSGAFDSNAKFGIFGADADADDDVDGELRDLLRTGGRRPHGDPGEPAGGSLSDLAETLRTAVSDLVGERAANLDSESPVGSAAGPSTEWPYPGDVPDHLPGEPGESPAAPPDCSGDDGGAPLPGGGASGSVPDVPIPPSDPVGPPTP